MGLKDETFSIRMLLRHGLVIDKSGIGAFHRQLALLRTLSGYVRTPAHQYFTQIPDSDICCGGQVNLAVNTCVHAIVVEPEYFRAHASLLNQPLADEAGG